MLLAYLLLSSCVYLQKVNEVVESGETYDPENPKCTGTAPMCDIHPTTTTTTLAPTTITSKAPTTTVPQTTTTKEHTPNECTEAMEMFPYPGDCHKYYICLPTETDGIFDITVSILTFLKPLKYVFVFL